jgi:hypothetical protein
MLTRYPVSTMNRIHTAAYTDGSQQLPGHRVVTGGYPAGRSAMLIEEPGWLPGRPSTQSQSTAPTDIIDVIDQPSGAGAFICR